MASVKISAPGLILVHAAFRVHYWARASRRRGLRKPAPIRWPDGQATTRGASGSKTLMLLALSPADSSMLAMLTVGFWNARASLLVGRVTSGQLGHPICIHNGASGLEGFREQRDVDN